MVEVAVSDKRQEKRILKEKGLRTHVTQFSHLLDDGFWLFQTPFFVLDPMEGVPETLEGKLDLASAAVALDKLCIVDERHRVLA